MARFRYYNRNPKGLTRQNDCVCRAISTATDLPYEVVLANLRKTAELFECDRYLMCCYKTYLQRVLNATPVYCHNISVGEFADTHPFGRFVVRTYGHLTTVINDTVLDIFDCRNEQATNAWQIH
nr:MAG TPA: hypothetical protein [Caudoviricetes sp.]